MYWKKVVDEFLHHKKILNQKISRPIKIRDFRTYYLGDNFANIYFTKREAECMLLMLKGKTILEIATKLSLSPRTIEFYTKNMKIKLACRTRNELMKLVANSDFTHNIDFDV